jgi:hypothetical protein
VCAQLAAKWFDQPRERSVITGASGFEVGGHGQTVDHI